MNNLKGIGKVIDLKMNRILNIKYKDVIILDNEHRFTPKFFELMSEVFLEIIEDAKNKNEKKS